MRLPVSKAILCIFIVISCFAEEKCLLDIPARSQWNFSNGYCGSCSIQMAALYYGSYISQDRVRKSIGDLEILFGKRMNEALDALSFEYDLWDGGSDIEKYFIWLKKELHEKSPVIVATKHGDNSNRYHHIILITGYTCDNLSTYNDNDTLFYSECHKKYISSQSFKTWQDNTVHNYFDPTRHYGTTVSSIKDSNSETLPVHLSVDHWDEPEPDETPVTFNADIKIRSLETGKAYILLKYTDHKKVPSSDFCNDSDFIFKKFTAAHDTATFSDSFLSNETAIFRCVRDFTTEIKKKHSDEIAVNHMHLKQLNPTCLIFSIPERSNVEVAVYNCQGQIVSSLIRTLLKEGNHTVDLGTSLTNGTYYLRMSTSTNTTVQKVLIFK